jgi:hypothetical protein
MEWMATITGDRVGYPGFWDFRDFSPRRKILGSKNLRIFRRQIFAVELANVFCFKKEMFGTNQLPAFAARWQHKF